MFGAIIAIELSVRHRVAFKFQTAAVWSKEYRRLFGARVSSLSLDILLFKFCLHFRSSPIRRSDDWIDQIPNLWSIISSII